jgi:hypothetical protein
MAGKREMEKRNIKKRISKAEKRKREGNFWCEEPDKKGDNRKIERHTNRKQEYKDKIVR